MTDNERLRRKNYISTEENGIWPLNEVFYIEAIIYSAGRAKDAFRRFDEAINASSDAATIVAIAHEALTHVAGLSRFFWPARNKEPLHIARAQNLKLAFGLDETSILSDRELRNALEHFDERLDMFLLQDLAGRFYPAPVVGVVSLISDIDYMFRLVDTTQDIFVLLGDKYSFRPLREVVADILQKAEKMKSQGGRLTRPD